MTKIWIAGFPEDTDDQTLMACFEILGIGVQVAYVSRDDNGKPRGFGAVVFETVEGYRRALAMNGWTWYEHKLTIRPWERKAVAA